MQEFEFFSKMVKTFAPGSEMIFDLGIGRQFFQGPENDKISPPELTITCQYRDHMSDFSETSVINLHLFDHTAASKVGELAELEGIKDEVQKLREVIKDFARDQDVEAEAVRAQKSKRGWRLR